MSEIPFLQMGDHGVPVVCVGVIDSSALVVWIRTPMV